MYYNIYFWYQKQNCLFWSPSLKKVTNLVVWENPVSATLNYGVKMGKKKPDK